NRPYASMLARSAAFRWSPFMTAVRVSTALDPGWRTPSSRDRPDASGRPTWWFGCLRTQSAGRTREDGGHRPATDLSPTVRLARSASEVITHTEATRNEVIQAFGIPAQRVTAVPSGVDERFFAAEPRDRAASPAAPLLMFPSAPIGRKNLDLVLRVLAAAKAP